MRQEQAAVSQYRQVLVEVLAQRLVQDRSDRQQQAQRGHALPRHYERLRGHHEAAAEDDLRRRNVDVPLEVDHVGRVLLLPLVPSQTPACRPVQ